MNLEFMKRIFSYFLLMKCRSEVEYFLSIKLEGQPLREEDDIVVILLLLPQKRGTTHPRILED